MNTPAEPLAAMRILGSIKMSVTRLNRFSLLLWGAVIFSCCASASGQVNGWTKRTSGQWHQSFWSAGERPNSTSHVLFTNGGWKVLAVNNITARDFPGDEFLVDGTVIHEGSLLTSSRLLHVGDAASGRYIFNSGHIRAQSLVIGRSGPSAPTRGVFEQLGR